MVSTDSLWYQHCQLCHSNKTVWAVCCIDFTMFRTWCRRNHNQAYCCCCCCCCSCFSSCESVQRLQWQQLLAKLISTQIFQSHLSHSEPLCCCCYRWCLRTSVSADDSHAVDCSVHWGQHEAFVCLADLGDVIKNGNHTGTNTGRPYNSVRLKAAAPRQEKLYAGWPPSLLYRSQRHGLWHVVTRHDSSTYSQRSFRN